jgi:S1-C subfamily serine protease
MLGLRRVVRGHAADGTTVNRNGTGFFVGNSRYVITANHVVMPPPQGWGKG